MIKVFSILEKLEKFLTQFLLKDEAQDNYETCNF